METKRVADVWRARRVQVYGRLHFRALGQLTHADAIRVKFLRDRRDLPDVNDILDENFTGGLATEEFLTRLRDGSLS